jgi:ATP-binding cassette, subfamily B, bacterial HlyB/CyaB
MSQPEPRLMTDHPFSTSLTCLAALLRHREVVLSEEELARRFALGPEELDDALILRITTDVGCRARRWRTSFRKLERLGEAFPVLARLKNGHMVIVNGVTPDNNVPEVVISDPLADRADFVFLSRPAFEAAWSGTLFLIRRETTEEGTERPFGIGWFVPEILRQWSLLRDVALAVMALHLLALALPIFFQLVVDRVLVHEAVTTLWVLVGGISIAILADALFGYTRTYLLLFATKRIDIRLARQTFAHLQGLPIGFFERLPAGLLTKHMQQTEQIRQFLTGRLFFTMLDASALLVFLPVLWIYSPKLTLITLGFAGAIALVIAALLVPYRRRLKELYDAEGGRQSLLVESIHGMRTIKTLAGEPQQQRDWEGKSARAVGTHFRVGKLAAAGGTITQALQKLLLVAIVGVGAFDVFAGTLTVGALIAFHMISGRVIDPLVQLTSLVQDYQETALSVRMLGTIMNEPGEHRAAGAALRPDMDGSIEFDGVTFRYGRSSTPALREISLRIEPGMVVGIVGQSGSGKTTITASSSACTPLRRVPSASPASTSANTTSATCAGTSGWCCRTASSSEARSATISRSRPPAPPSSGSWRRRNSPEPPSSSSVCPTATTPDWRSRPVTSPVASARGSPSPAPC